MELHEPQPVLLAGQQVFEGAVREALRHGTELQAHDAPGADVELLPRGQSGRLGRCGTCSMCVDQRSTHSHISGATLETAL